MVDAEKDVLGRHISRLGRGLAFTSEAAVSPIQLPKATPCSVSARLTDRFSMPNILMQGTGVFGPLEADDVVQPNAYTPVALMGLEYGKEDGSDNFLVICMGKYAVSHAVSLCLPRMVA